MTRAARIVWRIDPLLICAAIALIIIATIDADHAWTRVAAKRSSSLPNRLSDSSFSVSYVVNRMRHDAFFTLCAATVAAGLLYACDRETWTRRSFVQPGALAVTVVIIMAIPEVLTTAMSSRVHLNGSWYFDLRYRAEEVLSGAAMAAWLVTIVVGRWRNCLGWRERFGRVVGWGWMATMALTICDPLLSS